MDDQQVTESIDRLAREEHELYERAARGTATDGERQRLQQIQTRLDQCWDLLRQRRARREFGLDPDEAHLRDARTIEKYTG